MSQFSMSTLDAVNACLSNNGEEILSSLENVRDPQVAKALNVLNRVTYEVLQKGHNFNVQEKTLTQNVNGVIPIPSTWINFWFPNNQIDNVTVRDGIVWDRKQDQAWTQDIKILAIYNYSFDSIPAIFRTYITYEAALEYVSCYGSGMGSPQWASIKLKRDRARNSAWNSEYHRIPDAARLDLIYFWAGSTGITG